MSYFTKYRIPICFSVTGLRQTIIRTRFNFPRFASGARISFEFCLVYRIVYVFYIYLWWVLILLDRIKKSSKTNLQFLCFSEHETPLDLGIMIDASESVTNENWPFMLEFVSAVVHSFDISARGTHIGLIVFSRDAAITLYFNTLQEHNLTATNVTKVVNNLQYKDGWSRFDLALLLAEEELFNEATGMRNEISKV